MNKLKRPRFFEIEDDTYADFKAACSKNKITMKDVIANFMKNYAKRVFDGSKIRNSRAG